MLNRFDAKQRRSKRREEKNGETSRIGRMRPYSTIDNGIGIQNVFCEGALPWINCEGNATLWNEKNNIHNRCGVVIRNLNFTAILARLLNLFLIYKTRISCIVLLINTTCFGFIKH